MSTNASKYGHSPRMNIARLVPPAATRLVDIGCNTGGFGEALKSLRNVEVWGVEPDAGAAELASKVLDKVLTEPFTATTAVPDGAFDVVVFNDVLEHLVDPWGALHLAKKKLRPGGCVLASLPNFLHKENLQHLLIDRDFQYLETGIRDRTHLRFFTARSAKRLFDDCGYEVRSTDWINELWWPSTLWGRAIYKLFAKQLHETKYINFVMIAYPKSTAA